MSNLSGGLGITMGCHTGGTDYGEQKQSSDSSLQDAPRLVHHPSLVYDASRPSNVAPIICTTTHQSIGPS